MIKAELLLLLLLFGQRRARLTWSRTLRCGVQCDSYVTRRWGETRCLRCLMAETSQADLESNTALWFALWCVFLLVLLLHFTTCIWYRLACSGLHYQRTCSCRLHSWVMHMDTVYGTPSPAYCSLLPPPPPPPPPAFHMLASV